MLSPQELELLTARVDGEMTPRQRRRVGRLLERSREARQVLRQLQEDARQIRQLPLVPAPIDLSDSVLTIIKRRATPAAPRRLPAAPPARVPMWVGLASAAAVLLVVGFGSYVIHLDENPPVPAGPAMAHNKNKDEKKAPVVPRTTPPDEALDEDPLPPEKIATTFDPPPPAKGEPDRAPPFKDPTPAPNPVVLASGGNDAVGKFESVDAALPTVWKLHDLDKGDQAARLRAELRTSSAFRVEVLARDGTRSFDRLRAALQAKNVGLTFDPTVAGRLKRTLWKTDYAVYLENVTPADVVEILTAAGVADRQAADKKPGEQRFDGGVVVKAMAQPDRRALVALLGLDPVSTRPTKAAEKPELAAYVTWFAAVGPKRPDELKRYLDGRTAEKPGTIQVYLVLRHLGG